MEPMRASLPSTWGVSKLGSIAEGFLSGGTPSTKKLEYWHGTVPWITSKWLNAHLYLDSGEKFISDDAVQESSTAIVPRNSLIFATRVGVGKVAINSLDLAINQDLAGIFIDSERYDISFLAYQLRSERIQNEITLHKRGATIQGITRENLKELTLFLPPLSEQHQIAAVLGLVQRAIEQQEKLMQVTMELKKTLLHKLFTEGLRGEPQKQTEIGPVPESWEVVSLESTSVSFDYGTSVKCEKGKAGFPVLRIPNIVSGAVDLADIKHGQPKPTELQPLRLMPGDLLFVRTNGVLENAGRCAVYRGELGEDSYFASYLIRVRTNKSKLLPHFLNEYAQTERGRSFLSGKAIRTADGKFNINTGTLKRVLLPLPNLAEQKTIVHQIDVVQRSVELHRAVLSSYTDLFRTLLQHLMTAQIRVNKIAVPEVAAEIIE